MPTKKVEMPKCKNESHEADWWAGPARIKYVKQKFAAPDGNKKLQGSSIVAGLNKTTSDQIATPPSSDRFWPVAQDWQD